MTLALALGRVNVDEMLSELSNSQFAEWMAYWEIAPFGPLRDDLRAGTIAAAPYNTAFGRKNGSKLLSAKDFFDSLKSPKRIMSQGEMSINLRAHVHVLGGKFLTIKRN